MVYEQDPVKSEAQRKEDYARLERHTKRLQAIGDRKLAESAARIEARELEEYNGGFNAVPPDDFIPTMATMATTHLEQEDPQANLMEAFEQDRFAQSEKPHVITEDYQAQETQDKLDVSEGRTINWGQLMAQALAAGLVGGFDVINKTNNLPSVLDAQTKMRERYDARMKRVKRLRLFVENNPGSEDAIAKMGGMEVLADYDDAQLAGAFASIGEAEDLEAQLNYMEKSGHFSNEQMLNYRANAKNPSMLGMMAQMDLSMADNESQKEFNDAKLASMQIQNESAEWSTIESPILARTDINEAAKQALITDEKNNFIAHKTAQYGGSRLFSSGITTDRGKPTEALPGVAQTKAASQASVGVQGQAATVEGEKTSWKNAQDRTVEENVDYVMKSRAGQLPAGESGRGSADERTAADLVTGSGEHKTAWANLSAARRTLSAVTNELSIKATMTPEKQEALEEWMAVTGLNDIKEAYGEQVFNTFMVDGTAPPDWKEHGEVFFKLANRLDGFDTKPTLGQIETSRQDFAASARSHKELQEKFGLPMEKSGAFYKDINERHKIKPEEYRDALIEDLSGLRFDDMLTTEFQNLPPDVQQAVKRRGWDRATQQLRPFKKAIEDIRGISLSNQQEVTRRAALSTQEGQQQIMSATGGDSVSGKAYGSTDFILDAENESIIPFEVSASYNKVVDWLVSEGDSDISSSVAKYLTPQQRKAIENRGGMGGQRSGLKKMYPHTEQDILEDHFMGRFRSATGGNTFQMDLDEASTFTDLQNDEFLAVSNYYMANVNPDALAIINNLTTEEYNEMPPDVQAEVEVIRGHDATINRMERLRGVDGKIDPNSVPTPGVVDYALNKHDIPYIHNILMEGAGTLNRGWTKQQANSQAYLYEMSDATADAQTIGQTAKAEGYRVEGGFPQAQATLLEEMNLNSQQNLAARYLAETLQHQEFNIISGKTKAGGETYSSTELYSWASLTGNMDYMDPFTSGVAGPSGAEVNLEAGEGGMSYDALFGKEGVKEATQIFQEVMRDPKGEPFTVVNAYVLKVAIPAAVLKSGGKVTQAELVSMWTERSPAVRDRVNGYYNSLQQLDPETRVEVYQYGADMDASDFSGLHKFSKGIGLSERTERLSSAIAEGLDEKDRKQAFEQAGKGASFSLAMQMGFSQIGIAEGESMGKF